MPTNRRRRSRSRRAHLGALADWERAFIDDAEITDDMRQRAGFYLFTLQRGPIGVERCRERCLMLWRMRNEERAAKGLPPVQPGRLLTKDEAAEYPELRKPVPAGWKQFAQKNC